MSDLYQLCKKRVKERIRQGDADSDVDVWTAILQVLAQEHRQNWLPLRVRTELGWRIFHSLRGLDVLQPLVEDDEITDIMVNGADQIYYEKKGWIQRHPDRFEDNRRLEDLIQRIVGTVNRSVNEANPIVDARLKDGSRVHAVLPPISLNGPILTIRKFRRDPITMAELIEWGTATKEIAAFLEAAVQNKKNIFVCGGTASGKTTLLNVLSNFIPPQERIITIEDAAELRLSSQNHVVTLEARGQNAEGKGAVTIRDLIKASLRMNPDRIIVGEVRGAEALDMLQAMNTGHEGSLSTGHANSCRDMLIRIETMVWMGAEMPLEAIRQQIASAIDLLVFTAKDRQGKRRITEIATIVGYEKGAIQLKSVMTRKEDDVIWKNQNPKTN